MRAMRAEQFSGYGGLKLVDLPKPAVTDGKVLVRITAAGVTPLDHTILSGQFHNSKPPLVLETPTVRQEGRRQRARTRSAADVFIASPNQNPPGPRRRRLRPSW